MKNEKNVHQMYHFQLQILFRVFQVWIRVVCAAKVYYVLQLGTLQWITERKCYLFIFYGRNFFVSRIQMLLLWVFFRLFLVKSRRIFLILKRITANDLELRFFYKSSELVAKKHSWKWRHQIFDKIKILTLLCPGEIGWMKFFNFHCMMWTKVKLVQWKRKKCRAKISIPSPPPVRTIFLLLQFSK